MPDLSRPRVRRQVAVQLRDPIGEQAAYSRALQRLVVAPMRRLVAERLVPLVERWAAPQDASSLPARDTLSEYEIQRVIHEMQITMGEVVDSPELRAAIASTSRQVDLFNAATQQSIIKQVVAAHRLPMAVPAINVYANNPYLALARDQFVQRNVDLVKSLPRETFGQIQQTITEGIAQGKRSSTIAQELQERMDVTESRARLIARDQVLKHNGELASVRQQAAGITHFTWYSSKDQRVRKSHRDLHGKVFAWAEPPVVDGETAVPGQPIQCRCNAIPFLG